MWPGHVISVKPYLSEKQVEMKDELYDSSVSPLN